MQYCHIGRQAIARVRGGWLKSSLNPFTVTLAAIGAILAMPVVLPYMAISEARRRRRLQKFVSATTCEECGQLLGATSIELSNSEWRQHVQELHAKHPGVRFRLVRPHDSICPNCKTQCRFNPKQSEMVRVWVPDIRTAIDQQRRDLPDSPTKRALRASIMSTPRKHDNRWLLVYDISPNVLYDPKTCEYGLLENDNQVTVVRDIAGVVSSLENLA